MDLTNLPKQMTFQPRPAVSFKALQRTVRGSQTQGALSGKDVKFLKELNKDTKGTRAWTPSVWQKVAFYRVQEMTLEG